jgi:hypothetical protein
MVAGSPIQVSLPLDDHQDTRYHYPLLVRAMIRKAGAPVYTLRILGIAYLRQIYKRNNIIISIGCAAFNIASTRIASGTTYETGGMSADQRCSSH